MVRCVFLDRDGVINHKPKEGDYVRRRADFHLIPAIIDWIRLFNALDLKVIVITNQRGVALGLIEPDELDRIHCKMQDELQAAGAHIDDIFYCPHEKDACECRKPKPGLILAAVTKWNIDLERSVMIGDSLADRDLALFCGMRFIPVAEGRVIDRIPDLS